MKLILLFFCFFYPFVTEASPYPGTVWSSAVISDKLLGVRLVSDRGSKPVILTLSPKRLTSYQIVEQKLVKYKEIKAKKSQKWMKIEALDVTGDGSAEIVVVGLAQGRVFSQIYRAQNLTKILQVPYYLFGIEWNSQMTLVSQKTLGEAAYAGPIDRVQFDWTRLKTRDRLTLGATLNPTDRSVFSLQGVRLHPEKQGLINLTEDGALVYLQQDSKVFKKKWQSGARYGGAVYYLKKSIQNAMNQVENKRYFIPTSFQTNQRVLPSWPSGTAASAGPRPWRLYVSQNTSALKNVIGAVPAIKHSQMIRLVWTGHGLQEDWNSPRLDAAIPDFTLMDWNGDGIEDILAILALRDKAVFSNKNSILAVIPGS